MEWTIREARLSDCAAIARLNREEMGYDYPEEQTREKLERCWGTCTWRTTTCCIFPT